MSPNTKQAIDIHALPNLSLKAYLTIESLSASGKDRFSSTEIANFLIESVGIKTSRQAIEYALQIEADACHKNKQGYKLMQIGKDALHSHNKVNFIDSGKPFFAKNFTVREIFGKHYKELSICDPYVDINTLDIIYKNFIKGVPIRILTANVIDKPQGIFKRQLADLIKEGFNIEIRIYNKSTLHDRYIISDNNFWLCGNSLNYLGNKESFIVLLGNDVRQSVLSTYNTRWKDSVAL